MEVLMFNPYFNPYPNQFQNPYGNQFNQPQFITKQVSSIEEAKACLVDPLATYLFVDMNSGKIYMKRMNNNGLSDFYSFSVEQPQESKIDPMETINQRLSNIENILGGINVQSIPNSKSKPNDNANNAKAESGTFQKGSGNDKRQEQR